MTIRKETIQISNDDEFLQTQIRELQQDQAVKFPIEVEPIDLTRDRNIASADVLICCVGDESRWSVIHHRMPRKRTILLQPDDLPTYLVGKEGEALSVIRLDSQDPGETVREILKSLGTGLFSIAVDITAMTTPFYFVLLRSILKVNPSQRLMITYTEPEAYPDDDLTLGHSHIQPIPGFFGSYDAGKPTLLVTLMGFEGRRTSAVWREVDPDKTISINAFPAFRPGWENRSFRANLDFLLSSGAIDQVLSAPANQPAIALQKLARVYHTFRSDYNIYLAPLSSKPLGLAACLLGTIYSDVKVVYHYPRLRGIPSVGVGRSWMYHFNISDLSPKFRHAQTNY